MLQNRSNQFSGRMGLLLLIPAAVVAANCTDEGPAAPEGEGDDEPGTASPAVVSTDPAPNAMDVSIGTSISATFSEDMDASTLNSNTFTVEPSVSGSVSYSGGAVTFTPASDLDHGTEYTATITTGATSAAGNPLEARHEWSFTTAAPSGPPLAVPLEAGRRWRYETESYTSICAASTGCSISTTTGITYLHVQEPVTYQGRSAWLIMRYDFEENESPAFSTQSKLVAQDASGFWKWVERGSGSEWRRVLAFSDPVLDNGTFFLVPGPNNGASITLSNSFITVPAGSFSTLESLYDYRDTGQYATEDVFETSREHYADGVGLVYGSWDFSNDDNDPQAADVVSRGEYSLTHMDTGPFPDFISGAEPNDTTTSATSATAFAIISGDINILDPGAILEDTAVGCADCIYANLNGEQRFQDWYRMEVTQETTVLIELDFELYLGPSSITNDLDLYVFEETGSGPQYITAGLSSDHGDEVLGATLAPGTYYIAIQAWSTPTGQVSYSLSIR